MHRSNVPTTEDIDNFSFAASVRIADLLRGELDIDADFAGDFGECEDDIALAA